MTSPLVRAVGTAALALALVAGAAALARAPGAPTPDVLASLDISPPDRQRLGQGEVVSYPVNEYSDRELAVGVAIQLRFPLSDLAEYLEAGQLITQDNSIASYGVIGEGGGPEAMSGARFGRGEADEARSLLDASPGYRFNLSLPEIAALRALKGSAAASSSADQAQAASDEYRNLLAQRWQAYRRGGLGAIAPYARGGGAVTEPAADLRSAVADADRLRAYEPGLSPALLRYPAAPLPQAINRGYWIKRQVQRRPTISLLHQMVASGPDLVIHVERYVYVGHSYNDAQIITGAVASEAGSVLFATSRFSTDEVLGVGNQLKRAVGRSQLKDEMRKRLEAVRAAFRRPPAPPSPQSP